MHLDWEYWRNLLWTLGITACALLAGLVLHKILHRLAHRMAHRIEHTILISKTARPFMAVLPLSLILAVFPDVPLPAHVEERVRHLLLLCLIGTLGWLAVCVLEYGEYLVEQRFHNASADPGMARRVRTQLQLFGRFAAAGLVLATAAVMLLTFPAIWSLGASLLASAGLAGIAAGMAARPALSNLLAGVQVALTNPMRIDDVVIVEGEWGAIEEVNTTYVVVRTWDLRRLIVPLTNFIEKPFQNWTRNSTELLGTAFFYVDYAAPVSELRRVLQDIVKESDLWNGKVCALQVTDAKEQTLELRALVSADDSSKLFDLRCHVRERLIGFLKDHYPECLPRTRAELSNMVEDDSAAQGGAPRLVSSAAVLGRSAGQS